MLTLDLLPYFQDGNTHRLIIECESLSDPALMAVLGRDFSATSDGEARGSIKLCPPVAFTWKGPNALLVAFTRVQLEHQDGQHPVFNSRNPREFNTICLPK